MQIRDGLHIFGRVPAERAAQWSRGVHRAPAALGYQAAGCVTFHRALAADLGLGTPDPLTRDMADDYLGPRPGVLADVSDAVYAPQVTPSNRSKGWRCSLSPASCLPLYLDARHRCTSLDQCQTATRHRCLRWRGDGRIPQRPPRSVRAARSIWRADTWKPRC